jgi:hypothetical protein
MKKLSILFLLLATMFAATAQNRFPHNLPIELRAATIELTVDGDYLQMVSGDAVDKMVESPNDVIRPERTAPFRKSASFAGSGTVESPYLIGTAAQLAELATLVNESNTNFNNRHYRLTANIDLSNYGANINNGQGWMPITGFRGVFDGDNHTISGLFINRTGSVGFFGSITLGTVKNVGLTNVNIAGGVSTGGLASSISNGQIINSYVTGTVNGSQRVAGIVVTASNSNIINCYFSGSITVTHGGIGGIVHSLENSTVINSYSTGTITDVAQSSFGWGAGGIAGRMSGGPTNASHIINSYSTATIHAHYQTGGIVGQGGAAVNSILNSAALNSSVSGTNVGRITGILSATHSGNRALSTMELFFPQSWGDEIVVVTDREHNQPNGADMTMSEALTASFWTFAANWQGGKGWDATAWNFVDGQLPTLKNTFVFNDITYAHILAFTPVSLGFISDGTVKIPTFVIRMMSDTLVLDKDYTVTITSTDGDGTSAGINPGVVTIKIAGIGNYVGERILTYTIIEPSPLSNGSGTETDPYTINTPAQLAWLAQVVNIGDTTFNNKYYKLTADLDLSEYGENFNEGGGWVPIGFPTNTFRGIFDGNNHIITGLYINTTLSRVGLFGGVTGSVKNLKLENVNIRGSSTIGAVAGLAGGPIINCYSSGTITGTSNDIGGIVGSSATVANSEESTIINCHSSARVSGNQNVGGIIGSAFHNVVNSSFTGVVSGSMSVGGIAGRLWRAVITNCYSTDSVIGGGSQQRIGGVVGSFEGGHVINSYATGVVIGQQAVGGVAGHIQENSGRNSYVANNAALNPRVAGGTLVGRVGYVNPNTSMGWARNITSGHGILSGNRALNTLVDRNEDVTSWIKTTHDSIDGASMTEVNAKTASFWTTASNWQGSAWDTAFWNFTDGQLPTLKTNVYPFDYAIITLSSESFFYDGSAKMPTVTVRYGGTTLTEGTDYTMVTTSIDGKETSVGTKTGIVTITVVGKGGYVGEKKSNFLIINPLKGTGTNNDPFLITTAEQLAWMAQMVNSDTTYAKSSYKLMADLDISAYGKGFNNGRGWISIGACIYQSGGNNYFRGQFDGNHKTINGLYIQDSSRTNAMLNVGLFGSMFNGTIKNLGVTNISVRGGAVAGLVQYVENGMVLNCYTTGEVTGIGSRTSFGGFAGGIANQIFNSAIVNSYSTCAVRSNSGDGIGGISFAMLGNSRIVSSVALNPSVLMSSGGGWGTARIAHTSGNNNVFSGNRGLSTMVNFDGSTTWTRKGHDSHDGADITMSEALTASFWTNLANWQGAGWDATVWNFVDGQLPTFQKTATLPIITSNDMPSGNLITNYNQQLSTISDEFAVWALKSGRLPDGLDLFHTGLISGRPSKVGTFNFTVGAFNSVGSDTTQLTIVVAGEITPPVITTTSLPHGVVGETYSQILVSSGSPAIVWALEKGNLPSDVELYSDGTIAGTPSKVGEFTFTALVVNEAGFDTNSFTITIQPGSGTSTLPAEKSSQATSLQALIVDGKLQASGLIVGQRWTVYSILGTLVHQGIANSDTAEINLPIRGTYIIQQLNRSIKIVY